MTFYFVGIHASFKGGKDTLAGWLAASLRTWLSRVEIRHFAASLRAAMEVMAGGKIKAAETWSEEDKARLVPAGITWQLGLVMTKITPNQRKEWQTRYEAELGKMTIGRALQLLGEMGREIEGENIWVDRFQAALPKLEPGTKCVILIPDFRFPNEGDYLLRRDGILFNIDNTGRKIEDKTQRDTKHISETALKDWKHWHLVIPNRTTLEEYRKQAQEAIYYVNARISGVNLSPNELVQLLQPRLKQLQDNADALYLLPPSQHDLVDIALEECRRGLLDDWIIDRPFGPTSVQTRVKYLVKPHSRLQ